MISRRDVLKMSGAGALALASSRVARAMAGVTVMPSHQMEATTPAHADGASMLSTAALRALPPLKPAGMIKRSGKKRTFTLVLAPSVIEPLPGHKVGVLAINGISPGPVLFFTEGDDVEVTVVNRLDQGSAIHWHGVPEPFLMDGTAMISQDPIQPGGMFVYRFVAPQAGTYMYHAHYHEIEQDSVIGMIVVRPQQREPHYDVDFPIVITSVDWEPARRVEAQAVLANSMLMPSMATNPNADRNQVWAMR
jgi:FtsP/CotA-like multicopper oxidase with cupredoxin domain